MENTKNFFENWAETQKTMFDTWAENTREFQKNLTGGYTIAKGTEMYQDWLNKQKENIKSFGGVVEKTAENAKDEATHTFDSFLNQWKTMQDKTAEMWSENTKKMNDFFSGFGFNHNATPAGFAENMMDNARKYQESWMASIKSMTDSIKMPYEMEAADFSAKTIRDAYNSLQKGSENFMKLYELWAPVFKASQNNVFSVEEYKKLMNPSVYKDLMDKMFGFDAMNPLKANYDHYMKAVTGMFDNLTGSAKENYDSFKASMEQFASKLPESQAFFTEMYAKMNNQLKTSVSPFFKLMPDGKEKEQIIEMNMLSELYIESATKLANLQYLVYKKGAEVNEMMLEEIAAKTKEGKMDTDFTAFYNNWINVNGKEFENLFHTDDFSKLQAELLTLDSKIRTSTDKLVENALAPYPVVLKSQLDELYKANYDLKKQVYEMGKQMAAMTKTNGSATKAAPVVEADAVTVVKEETPAAAKASATSRKK